MMRRSPRSVAHALSLRRLARQHHTADAQPLAVRIWLSVLRALHASRARQARRFVSRNPQLLPDSARPAAGETTSREIS